MRLPKVSPRTLDTALLVLLVMFMAAAVHAAFTDDTGNMIGWAVLALVVVQFGKE